jgi:hypothetical protein
MPHPTNVGLRCANPTYSIADLPMLLYLTQRAPKKNLAAAYGDKVCILGCPGSPGRNSGIDRVTEGKDTLAYFWLFQVVGLKFLSFPERAPHRHSARRLR